MKVYNPGTKVKWNKTQKGVIYGISYKNGKMSYLVRWKEGYEGYDGWIPEYQLESYISAPVYRASIAK